MRSLNSNSTRTMYDYPITVEVDAEDVDEAMEEALRQANFASYQEFN